MPGINVFICYFVCPVVYYRIILEANPGLGYLSKRLVEMGCRQLYLYSQRSIFTPELRKLAENSPVIRLVEENILSLNSILEFDSAHETDRGDSILAGLPVQEDWASPPKVTLFAPLNVVTERGFLRSILYMIPPRKGLFHLGRVELLVFMSAAEYDKLTGPATSPGYTPRARNHYIGPYPLLYTLLLESEHVDTVDSSNFLSTRMSNTFRSNLLYLVRLRPRQKLPEAIDDPAHFDEFVFFIHQCLRRKVPLARCLDMWIPHAYRDVFVEQAKPDSPLRDLYFGSRLANTTPEQILELYRILRSHEAFEYSPFTIAMQNCAR